ncbi:hypothetical protein [Pseudooceanicola sp. HF7]|nr:hypothetical protein [Pseudooceanicola sp. HF7]NIZ08360.1 hypothetical protein [Pseudooceanicola sp. HF7]
MNTEKSKAADALRVLEEQLSYYSAEVPSAQKDTAKPAPEYVPYAA